MELEEIECISNGDETLGRDLGNYRQVVKSLQNIYFNRTQIY